MKLTLLDPNEGKTSVIDVSPDDPIENIKALAEIDVKNLLYKKIKDKISQRVLLNISSILR